MHSYFKYYKCVYNSLYNHKAHLSQKIIRTFCNYIQQVNVINNFIFEIAMINQQQLLKKLRLISVVHPLLKVSRQAQLRLSNQIYSNRAIRNIRKFIRQQNQIIKKTKQGGSEVKKIKTQPNEGNGRYDENQLKQLSFQFQSVKQKYLTHDYPFGFDTTKFIASNLQAMNRKRQAYRNKLNDLGKIPRLVKRSTIIGMNINTSNSMIPTINRQTLNGQRLNRMKSLTINSNISKQSPEIKYPPSPKIRRRGNTIVQQPQQIKISLKQDELKRAIDNLINLINTPQSRHYFIPRQLIFRKIQQKYKLKVSLTQQHIQVKKNKFDDTEKEIKFRAQIPYCQFNNLSDSRASVDRIFNMPIKAAQRISFKIYDRNGNGIIDQKDIIQLFTIAQQFQSMQTDMELIVKNYRVTNNPVQSNININRKSIKKLSKRTDTSDFSISKLNKMQAIKEEDLDNQQHTSGKFRKSNYFIFRQSKQQFLKNNKSTPSTVISLTWQGFQQAFGNRRPQIFYDLLDYLFNINSEFVFEKAQKAFIQQQLKTNRFMLFNNSDGKSEAGSYNASGSRANTGRKLAALDTKDKQKSNFTKTSKKKKQQYNDQDKDLTKKKINSIIGKAKEIEYFQSIKYCS